ncbi:MAG: AIR synthase-related protein [Veillonella sp.]
MQRLFRRPEVTTLIKRCNDFGAGGVSVAIGELTDGVTINLDLVPKSTAVLMVQNCLSESQERMACVVHQPMLMHL